MNSTNTCPITKETILLNLDAENKCDVIHSICGHLFIKNKTDNPSLLYQDIIKREKVVSTFAGCLTAIPHAITKYISEPTLCFARIRNDDFTWDGNDQDVRFVFLFSAPAQGELKQLRQSQSYVFSSIAQLISDTETLDLWATATDEQVILDSLSDAFEAHQHTKTS